MEDRRELVHPTVESIDGRRFLSHIDELILRCDGYVRHVPEGPELSEQLEHRRPPTLFQDDAGEGDWLDLARTVPKRHFLTEEIGAHGGRLRASFRGEEIRLVASPRPLDVGEPFPNQTLGHQRTDVLNDVLDPDSRRACDRFLRDLRRGFVRV